MADFSFHGLDELSLSLKEIADLPESIQKEILNAQADVAVDAQKASALAYDVNQYGDTIRSIEKGRPGKRKGIMGISVYPKGDRIRTTKKGKAHIYRNAEIGFVNEFGKKGQKARPFIQSANEKSAFESTRVAMEIYDRWLKENGL